MNRKGKTRIRNDREDEVSKIFINLYCVSDRFGISIDAERLQISYAPRKLNESI